MNLSDLVATRRRSLITLLSLVVVGGVAAAFLMPVGLFPNVSFPRVEVSIDAGDRPIDQTETTVTKPIETALRSIPDVTSLRTTTSRGEAEASLNFAWGSDMNLALQRVDAAMAQATQSMSGVTYQTRRMDPVVFPVAAYSLTSQTASPVELREFADRVLNPLLTTVPGVKRAESQGGGAGEYRISADPDKLRAMGLTLGDVSMAISNANVLTAAGKLEDRGKLLLVLTDSRLSNVREIGDVPIHVASGAVVRVADVAEVTAAQAPQWIRVTADGRDAVLVNLFQQPGGNTVKIVQAAAKLFKSAQGLGPAHIVFSNWYDQSQLITKSASALRDAIIIGVLLAGLVLLIFLRDWKITLAAVVVVPATLAATTLVLKVLGEGFNIMTLGGMAAAIGLIIDDAIVMLEHIERRLQGAGAQTAGVVQRATSEFLKPLFGSSSATIVIFLPLAFLSGVTGAFFKALSITMAIALAFSFLMAWWVIPGLAKGLLAEGREASGVNPNGRLTRVYGRALRSAVGAPVATLICALAMVALGLTAFLNVGSGFMPKMDEGGFILDYIAPPGSSLEETDRLLRQVEGIIRANPAVETYSRRTGVQLGGGLTEANTGDFFVRLKDSKRPPIEDVMTEIRQKAQEQVPGLEIETAQLMEDLIGDLTDVPQPIEIQLYGADNDQLQSTAKRVADAIGSVRGVTEIKNGIVVVGDSLNVQIDPTKAALEGIDRTEAAHQIAALISGEVDTRVQSGAYLVDVRVWVPKGQRDRETQLLNLPLKAADGHLFPLREIADIKTLTGQSEIDRQDLRRMTPVTARVSGRDTGSAAKDVIRVLQKPGLVPAGVTYKMGGLYAQQTEAFKGMAVVFLGAIGAVFVLLLFLYENFKIAGAILTAPLISVFAVAIGLLITGVELNIMALMGATMILGITTEVAIFYFTEYESLLKDGVPPDEALIEAGLNRLRPIAMTTLAAILALTPLALALGAGASMEQPLAIAIIAGLVVQGPVVLLVMPAIFRLIGGLNSEGASSATEATG
jgi:multidrug efflux pump subunit AcrB